MKKYVIFDIDGTIAKIDPNRLKYIQQDKPDWDSFYKKVENDTPISDVVELMNVLRYKYDLVFCTGRREEVWQETVNWLEKKAGVRGYAYRLLMRPEGNKEHDTLVKPKLLLENGLTPENVVCIFEDRNSMVTKWRELGFTVMHVADGDF